MKAPGTMEDLKRLKSVFIPFYLLSLSLSLSFFLFSWNSWLLLFFMNHFLLKLLVAELTKTPENSIFFFIRMAWIIKCKQENEFISVKTSLVPECVCMKGRGLPDRTEMLMLKAVTIPMREEWLRWSVDVRAVSCCIVNKISWAKGFILKPVRNNLGKAKRDVRGRYCIDDCCKVDFML